MRAEELRIGNLIAMYKGDSFTFKAKDFTQLDIGNNILNCEPIPLTEEWLIKFGFKFNSFCFELNEHQIRTVDNGLSWIYWIDSRFITDIKYVHQLQNLYFVLTNKELIIKTLSN